MPGTGSIHDVILKDCLERHDLAGRIEVVNYPWADLVTEAVAHDEVAAAFGTPALAVAIRRFAGGRILYPPSRLWPGNPSCGIVVSRTFLGDHRPLVERFLRLHEEATEVLRTDPAAAARDIAAHVGIIDEDFVLETLAGFAALLRPADRGVRRRDDGVRQDAQAARLHRSRCHGAGDLRSHASSTPSTRSPTTTAVTADLTPRPASW